MESTQSLLQQIESTRKSSSVVLAEVPLKTRAGFEMRKRQAEIALPGLLTKLQKAVVPSRLIGLVATGPGAGKVGEFLAANGGVVLDAEALYRVLAKHVEGTFNTERRFLQNQYAGIVLKAEEIAADLGFEGVRFEYLEDRCPTAAATTAHVRKMIRASLGDRFNQLYLAREAANQVVARKLEEEKLPAVLLNATAHEQSGLRGLFAKAATADFPADTEVTKEVIVNALRTAT